jgi:hypothetical protein
MGHREEDGVNLPFGAPQFDGRQGMIVVGPDRLRPPSKW